MVVCFPPLFFPHSPSNKIGSYKWLVDHKPKANKNIPIL